MEQSRHFLQEWYGNPSFGGALAAKKLSGTKGLLTTVFAILIFCVAA